MKEDLIWAGSKVAVLRYAPQTLISPCCPAESCTVVHLLCGVQAHVATAQYDKSSAATYGRTRHFDGGLPCFFKTLLLCSTVEQKFMEATLAYQAGKPIVSDEEYDNLRRELRNKNSKVVQQVRLHSDLPCEWPSALYSGRSISRSLMLCIQILRRFKGRSRHACRWYILIMYLACLQGPRCSIRSKNIYADANPDYLKMTLLNLPAAILVNTLTQPFPSSVAVAC